MARSSRFRFALLVFLILLFAWKPPAHALAGPPPTQGVWMTPIGNPIWKPVDFHLFSALIGTAATGYDEFNQTSQALLPPPNHVLIPGLGVGPGAPHQPPYNTELAAGVANLRYHQGVRFNSTEFSNGMGVWLAWMNVPAPGTIGSSPDFTRGPIIPNNLFPIHVLGTSTRNSKAFNPFLGDFNVPPLSPPLPFNVGGHSHFPVFMADNADFGPPSANLNGSYVFHIRMVDQSGNGWQVKARFAVAP